jgi:glycine hydroxymethyltransferase
MTEPVVWPPETAALFGDAAARLRASGPAGVVAHVQQLVHDHDAWRPTTLSLLGAEGVMSETARSVLASDLASRVAEGLPGVRDTSTAPAVASRWSDELEATVVALCQALFRARYVEWRPVSTTMATAIVLRALCAPGETIAVQAMSGGANVSYHEAGVAGVLGLRTLELPATEHFGFDLDATAALIRRERPSCILVGGTKVLFRYPLRELRALADEVGARLVFDGAHLGPFIHAGLFNDPLAEGADVLVTGTHKLMGGPVGGLAMTNDAGVAARIERSVWPSFMQTRDQNKLAAAAIALAELLAFGREYAADVVANAQALAHALLARDVTVIGAERGCTETHQVLVRLGDGRAAEFARRCSTQRILLAQTNVFGEQGSAIAASGVRLSVAQITRLGMGVEQMGHVAELALRAGAGEAVLGEVAELMERHATVRYSFDAVPVGGGDAA